MEPKTKKQLEVTSNLSVIVKTTEACNLNCGYCYANCKKSKNKMSLPTAKNMISQMAYFNGKNTENSADEVKNASYFIWHGGEPLLLGLPFYTEIVNYEQELARQDYSFLNGVQTNGSLMTRDFAKFFKQNGFSVGMSLDGPKEINDLTRPYSIPRNGSKSTFDDVISAINILKEEGIRPGVISVINKYNIDSLPRVYDFLKSLDVVGKINPLIKAGRAKENYEDFGVDLERCLQANIELFDLWEKDKNPIHLDFFEKILLNVLSDGNMSSCYMNSCQKSFIAVDHLGDVYPCGHFVKDPEFRYGNINRQNLVDILSNPLRESFLRRSENISECKDCEYKPLCNGGCPYNAYALTGNHLAKDPHCDFYKGLFKHFFSKLNQYNGGKNGSSS